MGKEREYFIAFDTNEAPGLIRATKVTLGTELVRDPNKSFRIDLVDDPLYPALCRYVKANPPRGS